MQEYPDYVNFKELVIGISTIAQHLPPGSPVAALCLQALRQKCSSLYESTLVAVRTGRQQSISMLSGNAGSASTSSLLPVANKSKVGRSAGADANERNRRLQEGARKLQSLMVHLIPVVDLQVCHWATAELPRPGCPCCLGFMIAKAGAL